MLSGTLMTHYLRHWPLHCGLSTSGQIRSTVSLLLFLALSACSSVTLPETQDQSPRPAAISHSASGSPSASGSSATVPKFAADLFVARGFLGGADYERYALKDTVLWRECGGVVSGKKSSAPTLEGDEALKRDPNLDLAERRVETLKEAERENLIGLARAVLKERSTSLPQPGSVQAITGPGVFELSLTVDGTEERILTSVDAVSNSETRQLKAVKRFFSTLRSQGPTVCKAKTFFGM